MIDHELPKPGRGTLSLGRFAQAAGLSRKALRLYDQLGILVPDQVDPGSGYRYYHPDQLERARFIRLLREMDMPLAEIRRGLSAGTTAEAAQLVNKCQGEFETRAQQVQLASRKVLAYLNKEQEPMTVEVSIQRFPSCRAVCIRKNITVPAFQDFIPEALAKLHGFVSDQGGRISGDSMCFYHGPVNLQDDGPVEICFPFEGDLKPGDGIQVREIPDHQGAIGRANPEQSCFPGILEVWDDVLGWLSKNKLRLTDQAVPCYEIWHEDDSISVVQPFESGD